MNTHDVKIQGTVFAIPLRYTAGHPLTEGEAAALNQTFLENVRNNVAPKIKKLQDEGKEIVFDEWQKNVNEYAASYEFGERQVSLRLDPIDAEIKRIALGIVKELLKQGLASKKFTGKAKDYADQLDGWVEDLLKDPVQGAQVRKQAERNLKDKRNAAASLFDKITANKTE
jgi:hypothetical protein